MKLASRVDGNQKQIVDWLRAQGASVELLTKQGKGRADLVVGFADVTDWAEVKMPGKELRPNQRLWAALWRGSKPWLLRDTDDAMAMLASMASRRPDPRPVLGTRAGAGKGPRQGKRASIKSAPKQRS
jgi:hypothetical protein